MGTVFRLIRRAGRTLGWGFLVVALLALGGGLQPWVKGDAFMPLALGELWYRLDVGSLNFLQAIVQRYLHPAIWEYGVTPVLLQPAWVVFGILGGLLAWFLRRA
ncbi:MAG: hypothetical protein J4G10_00020 [Alphaproteobacteria bacterium]|nr:hypothetical protein [Alphaproteobacteria bacterium]